MIGFLASFVEELRRAGLPVSLVETIDAMDALAHVDLSDRDGFRETLRATLVKNERHHGAFDVAFDVFFASRVPVGEVEPLRLEAAGGGGGEAGTGGGGGGGDLDDADLTEAIFAALTARNRAALRSGVRQAVERYAGMEPGRPVGGSYYVYRTLRRLDVDELARRLAEMVASGSGAGGEAEDALASRLRADDAAALIAELRRAVEDEVRGRLVADRGHEAVAETLRRDAVEDLDMLNASMAEIQDIEHVIGPLTRKLAARLARQRRQDHRGKLDFRKTMRASLATGGVPADPKFRRTRPHRPEIVLLCDISGSMATFARFTLQFTYAMATQFSRLRAFVFVDAVDDVTDMLEPGNDFAEIFVRIHTESRAWRHGHSDYGAVFDEIVDGYVKELSPRTTVIIAGDARNNYQEPRADSLAEIADAVEAVYWLNPEPRSYWDTGDSVISRYSAACHDVFEVRNLRHLESFVEHLVDRRREPARPSERVSVPSLREPGRQRLPSTDLRRRPMRLLTDEAADE